MLMVKEWSSKQHLIITVMKVKELIEELKKLPENTSVFVRGEEGLGVPILTYTAGNLFIETEEEED